MRKIIGIILLGFACISAFNLLKTLNSPTGFGASSGNAAYDSGKRAGGFMVPIILGVLGLWCLASGGDSRPAPTPPRGTLPHPGDPSLRGGMGTFASNPARLDVNFWKWFIAKPQLLAVVVLFAVLGLWLAVRINVIPGICIIAAIFISISKTAKLAKSKFYKGDVCPAVVLDAARGLVAVMTNLSSRGEQLRAIKILKQPLKSMVGEPAHDGMRLATVAFYLGTMNERHWRDFSPEVINCFVDDPTGLQRVFESIPSGEWESLDRLMERLPDSAPGLYLMWGENPRQAPTSTSWLTSKITLVILSALVGLVLLVNAMHIFVRSHDHRGDYTYQPHPTPQAPTPTMGQDNSGTIPSPSPLPMQPHPLPTTSKETPRPTPTYVELAGKVVTVTNISGHVYENIKLVSADRHGVVYRNDQGGGSIPLRELSIAVLAEIGVPTNWPGIVLPNTAARSSSTLAGEGRFAVGSRVRVQWAGKLQGGTVVDADPSAIQVKMDDPVYRIPLWLGTNLVR